MKLHVGYICVGIATGFYLTLNFFATLPDGNMHITVCDVGQGDATYVRFPDGRDMLIDTGPNTRVMSCLGKHMPFWDRTIDMVLLTHPEQDHMGGLLEVLKRYTVRYVLHSRAFPPSGQFSDLTRQIGLRKVTDRLIHAGESIAVGNARIHIVWPEPPGSAHSSVLGVSSERVNDTSVVFWLRYGSFDAFFPGDADTKVQAGYIGTSLANTPVEVLKVPHHGSKTGLDTAFLEWLKPHTAIISVGKNTYGHPAQEILTLLANASTSVLRTDTVGDVEIVSDGASWTVNNK